MKALTWHAPKDVRVEEVEPPRVVDPQDVVIRITTSAICGSDLHIYRGRIPGILPGTVIGHEYVGIVEDRGPAVRRFKKGDRVGGAFRTACGACWYCRRRLYTHCENSMIFGYGLFFGNLQGTQAEYARIPLADTTLFLVPPEVSDEQAVFVGDTLGTAFFAAEIGEIHPGDVVAVVGCGPVGLLTQMVAYAYGASRVVAVDRIPSRLAFAERIGCIPVNVDREDPSAVVNRLTGGRGADVAIEAVGTEAALTLAIRLVRPGGVLAVIGVFAEETFPFPIREAFLKGLTVRHGLANVHAHMEEALAMILHGRLDPSSLVTHTLPLAEAPHGYLLFDRGDALKVILKT
jgi:threonine dehydrogenase-like Zn-dependent dehydrogenase